VGRKLLLAKAAGLSAKQGIRTAAVTGCAASLVHAHVVRKPLQKCRMKRRLLILWRSVPKDSQFNSLLDLQLSSLAMYLGPLPLEAAVVQCVEKTYLLADLNCPIRTRARSTESLLAL
jgi:hypothetical protein